MDRAPAIATHSSEISRPRRHQLPSLRGVGDRVDVAADDWLGLLADFWSESFRVNTPLAWAAWLAAAVTALACLWDPAVRWPVACLYCVGLVAVGNVSRRARLCSRRCFNGRWRMRWRRIRWCTSALWSVRDRLRELGAAWACRLADVRDAASDWRRNLGMRAADMAGLCR